MKAPVTVRKQGNSLKVENYLGKHIATVTPDEVIVHQALTYSELERVNHIAMDYEFMAENLIEEAAE